MTAIHLNVKDVAIAALAAYDAGKLSAQGPTPECSYRDRSGHPCAVGAALSDEDAARLDNEDISGVGYLLSAGMLATDDEDALAKLQTLHDNWASTPACDGLQSPSPEIQEQATKLERLFVTYARSLANRIDG